MGSKAMIALPRWGFLPILGALFLVASLSACGPTYQTFHDFTPPESAEGRMCVSQCQNIQNHCRSTCSAQLSACQSKVRLDAQIEYERYAQKQREAGKPVERSPSWYERPLSCSSYACTNACEGDFRVCYTNCGGRVTSTTLCTSGCDK